MVFVSIPIIRNLNLNLIQKNYLQVKNEIQVLLFFEIELMFNSQGISYLIDKLYIIDNLLNVINAI